MAISKAAESIIPTPFKLRLILSFAPLARCMRDGAASFREQAPAEVQSDGETQGGAQPVRILTPPTTVRRILKGDGRRRGCGRRGRVGGR